MPYVKGAPAMSIRYAVKAIIRKSGFNLSRISNAQFGVDLWFDIARLSERWGFPINRVFDVGANIGQTALPVLAHFPNAEVYSFEPHPDTFKRLAEALKGRGRAQAFNIALSDKSGEAELFTYDNDSMNSLSPTAPGSVRGDLAGQPAGRCEPKYRP
jgi:hypothetical protein